MTGSDHVVGFLTVGDISVKAWNKQELSISTSPVRPCIINILEIMMEYPALMHCP